jgi:hypothetical protein
MHLSINGMQDGRSSVSKRQDRGPRVGQGHLRRGFLDAATDGR